MSILIYGSVRHLSYAGTMSCFLLPTTLNYDELRRNQLICKPANHKRDPMTQSILLSAIGSILLATADSAVAEGVALPRSSPEAQGISSAGIREVVEAADRHGSS